MEDGSSLKGLKGERSVKRLKFVMKERLWN
jgi:hypothetical protein